MCGGILDDAKHSYLLQVITMWLPILYLGKPSYVKPVFEDIVLKQELVYAFSLW